VELGGLAIHLEPKVLGPADPSEVWPAVELAVVRSAVDGQIGLPTLEPMVTMLVAGSHTAAEPPRPRSGGPR
jgi:hypothetical protein